VLVTERLPNHSGKVGRPISAKKGFEEGKIAIKLRIGAGGVSACFVLGPMIEG
jgi:hypothetical protein